MLAERELDLLRFATTPPRSSRSSTPPRGRRAGRRSRWRASWIDTHAAPSRPAPSASSRRSWRSPRRRGDVRGAEEAVAVVAALAPDDAEIERVPCSSPDHAPDLLVRLRGPGARRILLLGHLDTVVAHDEHRAADARRRALLRLGHDRHEGRRRARARACCARSPTRAASFAEVALLLVMRRGVARRALRPRARASPASTPACASRPASSARRRPRGGRRPPQGGGHRSSVTAHGPQRALGLGARQGHQRAARAGRGGAGGRRAATTPHGPERLTAVPTVLHAGDALQRRARPRASWSATCAPTASRPSRRVLRGDPGGGRRRAPRGRARARVAGDGRARGDRAAARARRRSRSGARSSAAQRGGASDASHFARRRSPSPSTVSAPRRRRPRARRVRRWPRRCARAPRSRWPSRTPCWVDDGRSDGTSGELVKEDDQSPSYPLHSRGRL